MRDRQEMLDIIVVVDIVAAELIPLENESIPANDIHSDIPTARFAVSYGHPGPVFDEDPHALSVANEGRAVAVKRHVIRHDHDGLMVLAVRRQRGALGDAHGSSQEKQDREEVHPMISLREELVIVRSSA